MNEQSLCIVIFSNHFSNFLLLHAFMVFVHVSWYTSFSYFRPCFPISQLSPEPDSHPVAMSTSSLRRQVKNIVHNYSEAEIKVRGCFLFLSPLRHFPNKHPLSLLPFCL